MNGEISADIDNFDQSQAQAGEEASFLHSTKEHALKALTTGKEIVATLFSEIAEQTGEQESKVKKVAVAASAGAIALLAAGSQGADRIRVPESITMPFAISMAEQHGNEWGALALAAGIYATQFVIGGSWGLGIKHFKKTADTFDTAYPGYKGTLSEENAGYTTTLLRQSVLGLGTGNTPFVAAETLGKPNMTTGQVAGIAEKTSRRIAVAAGVIGYGALQLATHHYDRYLMFWSVPDVVDRLEKPTTWIALGISMEVGGRILGAGLNKIKSKVSGWFNRSSQSELVEAGVE